MQFPLVAGVGRMVMVFSDTRNAQEGDCAWAMGLHEWLHGYSAWIGTRRIWGR